ncbi:MAG: hypothetical protein HY980_04005 [Candidatus Magasanikbacteria bacterium]|nr:hypothetical protein [Candidatus Magasanikbacteria bacterium]
MPDTITHAVLLERVKGDFTKKQQQEGVARRESARETEGRIEKFMVELGKTYGASVEVLQRLMREELVDPAKISNELLELLQGRKFLERTIRGWSGDSEESEEERGMLLLGEDTDTESLKQLLIEAEGLKKNESVSPDLGMRKLALERFLLEKGLLEALRGERIGSVENTSISSPHDVVVENVRVGTF